MVSLVKCFGCRPTVYLFFLGPLILWLCPFSELYHSSIEKPVYSKSEAKLHLMHPAFRVDSCSLMPDSEHNIKHDLMESSEHKALGEQGWQREDQRGTVQ